MITLGWAMMFGALSVATGGGWILFKALGATDIFYRKSAFWCGIISWISAWVSIFILARL